MVGYARFYLGSDIWPLVMYPWLYLGYKIEILSANRWLSMLDFILVLKYEVLTSGYFLWIWIYLWMIVWFCHSFKSEEPITSVSEVWNSYQLHEWAVDCVQVLEGFTWDVRHHFSRVPGEVSRLARDLSTLFTGERNRKLELAQGQQQHVPLYTSHSSCLGGHISN